MIVFHGFPLNYVGCGLNDIAIDVALAKAVDETPRSSNSFTEAITLAMRSSMTWLSAQPRISAAFSTPGESMKLMPSKLKRAYADTLIVSDLGIR